MFYTMKEQNVRNIIFFFFFFIKFDVKIGRGNNSIMVTFYGEKMGWFFIAVELIYRTQYDFLTF